MSVTELLQENRSKGWVNLPTSAPSWVRDAVIEFRSGRPAAFNQLCERRSLSSLGRTATRFAKKLFRPAPRVDADLEAMRQRAFVQGQGILADFRAADVPLTAAERDAENTRRKARVKDIADVIREMGETL